MKKLARQVKGVAHCGSHAGPVVTSDSASHEGTGHLVQLCNFDALSSSPPLGSLERSGPSCEGERASIPFLAPSVLLLADLLP